jgi:hypothetical protein
VSEHDLRPKAEDHRGVIDDAGQFPSMFKGFGDHRIGQHHEDGAPANILMNACAVGSIFEQGKTRQ